MSSTYYGFLLFFTVSYGSIVIALCVPRLKAGRLIRHQTSSFVTTADNIIQTNTVKGDLLKKRISQTSSNVSVFYKKEGGLVITHGEGAHMIDEHGVRYLDCCNNVACVGHSHPMVVKAGQDALGKIQTNGRFLHPTQQRYLSKLLATFPCELDTVFLVNSGSEANDLALRIAQQHNTAARKNDVIVLDHAYHGHTGSLIGVSPYKWYQAIDGINRQPETTHIVSCPDSFRGIYRQNVSPRYCSSEEVGALYAQEIEAVIAKTGGVGTFIAESIVGCGGQIIPPVGYFQRCYDAVRAEGGVCIADEIQTGFGRAGNNFWAFQEHGVVPDIVTIGKPMGNGYPVAAVVCRRALADSFASTGIEYFNTFGGNSVACAIAEAVIDTIHSEGLQKNSLLVGEYLLQKLQELSLKHPCIGDVRGMGLFVGIEFIKVNSSHHDLIPHTELCQFLVAFMMKEKVLVSSDGPQKNVIKIKPPLVFSFDNADILTVALEKGLIQASKTDDFL